MILQKEFYFVRHGQTDHNLLDIQKRGDHSPEIPLNYTGREQAKNIEPLIASLPIKSVISSPMKRAVETREIITEKVQASHYEIDLLSECKTALWPALKQLHLDVDYPQEGDLYVFLDRVRRGINEALRLPGPPLIIAHGGIHFAACFLMRIEEYAWSIQNCETIHFFIKENGTWGAKRL